MHDWGIRSGNKNTVRSKDPKRTFNWRLTSLHTIVSSEEEVWSPEMSLDHDQSWKRSLSATIARIDFPIEQSRIHEVKGHVGPRPQHTEYFPSDGFEWNMVFASAH